jgi:23S rRNA (adenine2503-C2)-methyltransferase
VPADTTTPALQTPPPGDALERPHLLGQTQRGLEAWARARGATEPAARVLAQALLAEATGRTRKVSAGSPSRTLLDKAAAEFARALPEAEAIPDPDGTVRFAVRLHDGALVETVLIHQEGRDTVCVSSQVGCRRGCVFCETGRLGLKRDLAAWEIVAQYAIAARYQEARGVPAPGNVVYMGMGEPLDNLDNVITSIDVLREHAGFAVAERRITVSTVGIVPEMDALFARTKANLAVSLHALQPAVRKALLPVAHKWDLDVLRAAIARAPRTVLLQWTLIEGQNDSDADADLLVRFCESLDVRVNLIPLNPGPVAAQRAPPLERCRAFQKRLLDAGLRVMLRLPHGQTVGGACGQLAGARRAAQAG